MIAEAASRTLNTLGPVPGTATDFLYELGIAFHLLQISFCMRASSLVILPMAVMRMNCVASLVHDTF